jgi:hypothetical protein
LFRDLIAALPCCGAAIFIGAPGRAHLLDGDGKIFPKSITHPTGGSVSRTARVSIARWNLKEAAGKALARRTGSVYEASALDERANRLKVQYLYGKCRRICDGHKREGRCALPGEACQSVPVTGDYRCREATGWVVRGQQRPVKDRFDPYPRAERE